VDPESNDRETREARLLCDRRYERLNITGLTGVTWVFQSISPCRTFGARSLTRLTFPSPATLNAGDVVQPQR
jgi:hypothetical protein